MNERGQAMIEFALAFPLFLTLIAGLFFIAYGYIGGYFLEDATYDAARKYAVTLDRAAAEKVFNVPTRRWAFLFLDPKTVRVDFRIEGNRVRAIGTAEPRLKDFLFFSLPSLRREAMATLEYRFRNPGEFTH